MYIVFDGVSSKGYIWLYETHKTLIAEETFFIAGNESSKASSLIDEFLQRCEVSYEEIENIVTVVWPGSFTGVRTISLIVNTIAFIYPHISLTPLSFFDLYDSYPLVKSSSKRDLFVKWWKSATIEVISNGDFESQCENEIIYGDTNIERFQKAFELHSEISYKNILQWLQLKQEKKIAPLYIKKPNIS